VSNNPTWAYSRIKAFETCPRQYYHLNVVKDYAQGETESMLYGKRLHEALELYVGEGKPLAKEFEFCLPYVDKLLEIPGEKLVEYRMGLTEELEPCEFFARDVWFRSIADLLIVDRDNSIAYNIDYKSSKNTKYADVSQLELGALATFAHFPEIDKVRGGLLFPVCDDFCKKTYFRKDMDKLWDKWGHEYDRFNSAHQTEVFNPKPSGLCRRHCIVLSCEHNGRS